MAMLLAMFQKMRLIREKNQLVLEQTMFSSKLSRVEKNIERTQKRFTSLFAQLDSQAKMMQNNAKVQIQSLFNLGVNSFDPYNYSGINGNIYSNVMKAMTDGGWYKYKANTTDTDYTVLTGITDQTQLQNMMTYYQQHGTFHQIKDNDAVCGNPDDVSQQWDKHQCAAFLQAVQQAKITQQQQQQMCQQLTSSYENNVSIWLEAAKAQLETEQDAALEPLNYEQTMLELDKELKDQKLTRINAEIERYNELCKQETQNSAPSFGLG